MPAIVALASASFLIFDKDDELVELESSLEWPEWDNLVGACRG